MASYSSAFGAAFSIFDASEFYEIIDDLPPSTLREHYVQLLQNLLPPGPAWPRDHNSLLAKMIDGFAEEFAAIDVRSSILIREADPSTTSELLADWERVAGLPDLCTGVPVSVALRRELLVAKLTNVGGQSKLFFINLAAKLGYEITITEFRPFRTTSHVNEHLADSAWNFVWRVNSAQNTIRKFKATSRVNEPLASWGNLALQCMITRLKPAHTHVQFAYF